MPLIIRQAFLSVLASSVPTGYCPKNTLDSDSISAATVEGIIETDKSLTDINISSIDSDVGFFSLIFRITNQPLQGNVFDISPAPIYSLLGSRLMWLIALNNK